MYSFQLAVCLIRLVPTGQQQQAPMSPLNKTYGVRISESQLKLKGIKLFIKPFLKLGLNRKNKCLNAYFDCAYTSALLHSNIITIMNLHLL